MRYADSSCQNFKFLNDNFVEDEMIASFASDFQYFQIFQINDIISLVKFYLDSCFMLVVVNRTRHSFKLITTGNVIYNSSTLVFRKKVSVSHLIFLSKTFVFIFFYLENFHFSVIDEYTINKKKQQSCLMHCPVSIEYLDYHVPLRSMYWSIYNQ